MDWTRKFFEPAYWTEDAQQYDKPPDWHLKPFKKSRDLLPGAKVRPPPGAPKPDVVLLAFGTWDEAFSPYMNDFANALPHLRDAVLEAYPDSVIIIRLTHQVCCQKRESPFSRYSLARIQHHNDIIREVFKINEAGTHGSPLCGRKL